MKLVPWLLFLITLVIAIVLAQYVHFNEIPPGARPRAVKIGKPNGVVFEVVPVTPKNGEKITYETAPADKGYTTSRVIIAGPSSSHGSDLITREFELSKKQLDDLTAGLGNPPGTAVSIGVDDKPLYDALDAVISKADKIEYRVTFFGWYKDSKGKYLLSVEEKDGLEPGR